MIALNDLSNSNWSPS